MTCLMRVYVLRRHALLKKMSYGSSCGGGVHVFRMAYFIICFSYYT